MNAADATLPERLIWPSTRLGDALKALASRSGLSRGTVENPGCAAMLEDDHHQMDRWLAAAGLRIGVAVDSVEATHQEVAALLTSGAPALLPHEGGVVAVLGVRRKRLLLLGPSGVVEAVPMDVARRALVAHREASLRQKIAAMMDSADIAAGRRRRAEDALVNAILAHKPSKRAWTLSLPPGAPFAKQLRRAGMLRHLVLLLGCHAAQFVLFLLSWWIIGLGVLQGRLSSGWIIAWALLLITLVPLRMLATWSQGRLTTGVGVLLKRRLLQGAMQLETDKVRHQGVGGLIGRAIEAEMVERITLGGGFASALALVEFAMAAVVLASGAGGLVHVAVLLAWLALAVWLAVHLHRRRGQWTDRRLVLTDTTVESMVGHRTRLAQAHPDSWHVGEDDALWTYFESSGAMDRYTATLFVGIGRGWLIVGLLALAPAFIRGTDMGLLAAGLGGVLLAWQSFARLTDGINQLVGAHIAWQRAAPLFHAASRPITDASPDHAISTLPADEQPVLEAWSLGFRYPEQSVPLLSECNLIIRSGDRILLQGSSGSGKSTLGSLLLGLRTPDAGLILARGLDLPSLGELGWRRCITAAPQFHENHVLTDTFLFNLFMGGNWPPEPSEIRNALELCKELGLGSLIQRMPGGMLQMVGDTGWQLSHGERSRLFIARALLQQCDVLVLDESFAALDPDNLARTMRCVRKRANGLIVIAHP